MESRIREIINRIWNDLKGFAWVGVAFAVYYLIVHFFCGAFCPLLVLTGIPCAGCGLTRATLYLLQGQISRAAFMNPSIFLIIIFLLYCGCFRYIRGTRIKGFYAGLAILIAGMLVIYAYRMYLYFPERIPYVYFSNNVLAKMIPGYDKWVNHIIDQLRCPAP